MRIFLKWAGRIGAIFLLAVIAVGVWKREEILRLWTVQTLFDEDRIVANFSNMTGAFRYVALDRGDGPVSPLPQSGAMTMPAGYDAWVRERAITSVLVLHDGAIVHEAYYLGTRADDLRISWSMAKSYLSVLFGILVNEGVFSSLDDPVTDYVPELAGSAYEGASIRNVLQMSSGVVFDEDYLDYNSDINKMGRILALGGKMDEFAAGLKERFAAPGETWKYTSIDTHIVGMVARRATGRSLSDLMADKLMGPMGLEGSAAYLTDGVGVAFALGGLNITTRDYGRFAQMVLQDGRWNGAQIVPAAWLDAATAPSAPTKPGKIGYGYQWWIPVGAPPGQVMGRGIYGQYMLIDDASQVAIVITAADRGFRRSGVHDSNMAMLRQIIAATEGL